MYYTAMFGFGIESSYPYFEPDADIHGMTSGNPNGRTIILRQFVLKTD